MTLAPQFVWKCVNCSMRVATHGDLHINERPVCVQCNAEMESYQPGDDSEPSLSGKINALPDWARQYIHDIETKCDPAGDVRTITELRDTIRALEAEAAESPNADEINLIRQWFNAVKDLNPSYLAPADHALAERLG